MNGKSTLDWQVDITAGTGVPTFVAQSEVDPTKSYTVCSYDSGSGWEVDGDLLPPYAINGRYNILEALMECELAEIEQVEKEVGKW